MLLFTDGERKAKGISKWIAQGHRASKWQSQQDGSGIGLLTTAPHGLSESHPPQSPSQRGAESPKPEQTDGQLLLPEAAPSPQEELRLVESSLCTYRIRVLPKFCPPGLLACASSHQAPSGAL